MAVIRTSATGSATWLGLSTDTKPTANAAQPGPKAGDRFVATDTGAVYVFGPFGANGALQWSAAVANAKYIAGA